MTSSWTGCAGRRRSSSRTTTVGSSSCASIGVPETALPLLPSAQLRLSSHSCSVRCSCAIWRVAWRSLQPLPSDLRAFLTACRAVVAMSVHNGYWVGDVESLARLVGRNDFPRLVAWEPAVPVATDGGGNAFLLTSSGRVWRWDHETDNMREVAASFADFLERIADDWAAYVSDTQG